MATTDSGFTPAIDRQETALTSRSGTRIFALGLAAVTLVLTVIFVRAIAGYAEDHDSDRMAVAIVLAMFIDVPLILLTVRQLFVITSPMVDPVVSTPAIAAGKELTITWTISGRVERLESLSMELAGYEMKTHMRHGSPGGPTFSGRSGGGSGGDIAFDTTVLATIPVVSLTRAQIARSGVARVSIPRDAPLSYFGSDRRIYWRLSVRGVIPNSRDISDQYPIAVSPPLTGN